MFHSTFTSVVSTQHLDCGFKNLLLLLLLLLLFSKREKTMAILKIVQTFILLTVSKHVLTKTNEL